MAEMEKNNPRTYILSAASLAGARTFSVDSQAEKSEVRLAVYRAILLSTG